MSPEVDPSDSQIENTNASSEFQETNSVVSEKVSPIPAQDVRPFVEPSVTSADIQFPTQDLPKVMQDQTQPQAKIEIRDLHMLQTEPKELQYKVVKEVNGIKVESAEALNFETHPNPKDGKRLEELVKINNPLLFKLKTFQIIGGNMVLQKLNKDGVPTGLSHGTMDYIYRIGVGEKVDGLLDNLALAVGCLQRRCQIADVIEKTIRNDSCGQIISIAGGTCILPLEAAYQSKKDGLTIMNMDFSDRANQKASDTLQALEEQAGYRNIKLGYTNADLLSDKIPAKNSQVKEIVECTGFWEYLSPEDRDRLLRNISERMQNGDTFVLTALVNNPQRDIFGALKFKELKPQPLEELTAQVQNQFKIERAILTPNETYATLVLKKNTDL